MLTIGRIASAVALVPGGVLTDAVRSKRTLVAAGIIMIGAAALIFALHPTFLFVIAAEILHGATAGIVTPAIAAISLGIVGRQKMSSRIGRNHRYDAGWQCRNSGCYGDTCQLCGQKQHLLGRSRPDLAGAHRVALRAPGRDRL
jgi:hypothetical protein